MEDWEQFFQEKSRRRFDKDRRYRRRRRIEMLVAGTAVALVIAAGIMGITFFD